MSAPTRCRFAHFGQRPPRGLCGHARPGGSPSQGAEGRGDGGRARFASRGRPVALARAVHAVPAVPKVRLHDRRGRSARRTRRSLARAPARGVGGARAHRLRERRLRARRRDGPERFRAPGRLHRVGRRRRARPLRRRAHSERRRDLPHPAQLRLVRERSPAERRRRTHPRKRRARRRRRPAPRAARRPRPRRRARRGPGVSGGERVAADADGRESGDPPERKMSAAPPSVDAVARRVLGPRVPERPLRKSCRKSLVVLPVPRAPPRRGLRRRRESLARGDARDASRGDVPPGIRRASRGGREGRVRALRRPRADRRVQLPVICFSRPVSPASVFVPARARDGAQPVVPRGGGGAFRARERAPSARTAAVRRDVVGVGVASRRARPDGRPREPPQETSRVRVRVPPLDGRPRDGASGLRAGRPRADILRREGRRGSPPALRLRRRRQRRAGRVVQRRLPAEHAGVGPKRRGGAPGRAGREVHVPRARGGGDARDDEGGRRRRRRGEGTKRKGRRRARRRARAAAGPRRGPRRLPRGRGR